MERQLFFSSPNETLERYKAGEINEEEAFRVLKAFPNKLEIPRHYFENQTVASEISNESDEKFELEGMNFNGKLSVLIKGALYPHKTIVETGMLGAANIVKSIFIEPIKILSVWFIPALVSIIFSTKRLEKVIEGFNRVSWRAISQYILKEEHQTDFTPQLCFCIFTFMHKLGISEFTAYRFAQITSTLIEYDNAYRLRIEDIMTETTKEKLQNPRKELKRLSNLFTKREINPTVTSKVKKLIGLISLALLIPKVKHAALETIKVMELEKLQLDDADRYFLCMRKDYQAMGMTYEERQEYAKARGWTFPIMLPIPKKGDVVQL